MDADTTTASASIRQEDELEDPELSLGEDKGGQGDAKEEESDVKETAAIGSDVTTSERSKQNTDEPDMSRSGESPRIKINGMDGAESIAPEPTADDDADGVEQRWLEESREYVERIDALQSKLQYLAKEAAESAKSAAVAAKAGSPERKLLEKDERIALLMAEGQQLSKKEMSHLSTQKKMRAQASDAEKSHTLTRKRAETAENALVRAEERAKRAEANSRRAEDNLRSISQTDRDVSALTRERDALKATVIDIKSQLQRAVSRAEEAETKYQTDALDREKRKTAELQDDLTSAKIERELGEEKLRREIRDLKANLEREKDQGKSLESELRGEQSVLESKLESLRARAEESTSDAKGESQAKLLRQIEQLQTQYSLASENWHGIENSLLARLSAVEKERDEIVQKEADTRRRLRESNIKSKKLDAELEKAKETVLEVEQNTSEKEHEANLLSQRIKYTEARCQESESEFEKRREDMEAAFAVRLAEERRKWLETSPIPTMPILNQRTESPGTSVRKFSSFDVNQNSNSTSNHAGSRRQSSIPMQVLDTNNLPSRQASFDRIPLITQHPPQTPSISSTENQDFPFSSNGNRTPASPPIPRGVNELMSASTIAAGPSVQLVERMSASVRRLESERATNKDEMARLVVQRDEARQEVVDLMREVDQKRKLDVKVVELEKEQAELNARYHATLEMLGEKSEQVEELKADVVDIKGMYRELVDRTMK